MKSVIHLFALINALIASTSVWAANQNFRVGTGTGCTHTTLQAALTALQAETGSHTIRINKGVYAVPDGMSYNPTLAQTAVFLEGGYDNCTAATPTGDPTQDAHRAIFDGAGGQNRPVLNLAIYGEVGTVQLRRIALQGGDATVDGPSGDDRYEAGGGLIVRGQASVLLGLGASIRNNAARFGGGVALSGSSILQDTGYFGRVDFFIDEGAEIRNNTAEFNGGGIYCGGDNDNPDPTAFSDRHGSIVFRDGTISNNQANSGAAFYCRGSLDGGGGFQPRPRTGAAAWIIGNSRVTTGTGVGCAAGFGTLDASQAVESDGYRHLGAAADSNGLLAITANVATAANNGVPALCLVGSRPRNGANDPAPVGQSRFRIRNLYVSDQGGGGVLGLRVTDALDLVVEPSGNTVNCMFFSATPCVRFFNNFTEGPSDNPATGDLIAVIDRARLLLNRAKIDDNLTRPSLTMADNAELVLLSSIIDNNTVARRNVLPETSGLFSSRFAGRTEIEHSTIINRAPLDFFFRIGWNPLGDDTGTARARASIFASTSGTPLNLGETASPSRFTREWCGFFQSTAGTDFTGHTVLLDPGRASFDVLPPMALSLDASYAPLSSGLRDACTPPALVRDFYGNAFTTFFESGSTWADIGAVEAQRANALFANGFE